MQEAGVNDVNKEIKDSGQPTGSPKQTVEGLADQRALDINRENKLIEQGNRRSGMRRDSRFLPWGRQMVD